MKQSFLIFLSAIGFLAFPLLMTSNSISGQSVEDEIIANTLETVEKATTKGLSEITESVDNASKSVAGHSDFKEYKSEPIGIKLQIPSEWYILSENNKTEDCFGVGEDLDCSVMMYNTNFFLNPENAKYVFLVSKNSFNGSLKDFTKHQFNQLQNSETNKEFSFIDDKETTIQGYPAWQIEYTRKGIFDKESAKEMETFVKVNNTFYSLSYLPNTLLDYDKYLPEVQNVLQTIEFIPSKLPEEKKPSFLD
jgi:hypothetical protein